MFIARCREFEDITGSLDCKIIERDTEGLNGWDTQVVTIIRGQRSKPMALKFLETIDPKDIYGIKWGSSFISIIYRKSVYS